MKQMVRRYVYPELIYDSQKALRIQRSGEDGEHWFGTDDAIREYCREYGLKMDEVEWLVWIADISDYTRIVAKSLKDWLTQFNQLGIVWRKQT